MDFQSVLNTRRMCRRFAATPIPDPVLRRILRNALRAPNAGFSQGWDFLVLADAADLAKFWQITTSEVDQESSPTRQRWRAGVTPAPVLVLCCSDPQRYHDRYAAPDKSAVAGQGWPIAYWDVDTGMAALLMLLTACEQEVGALFFGVPAAAHDGVRDAFGIPEDRRLVGAVALGYPRGDIPDEASGQRPGTGPGTRPSARPRRRNPGEVVHEGRFGTPAPFLFD